jgi:acetylornithine aminotransferase/acetylornithine/N-succinyldiaminopimelate aminotransferase
LRRLCDEKNLLLMIDAVQCGHFRTGRFQSFQRVLEDLGGRGSFLPDALSMAKSLGGGFPMGAFWVRDTYADLLGAGTHGTTFGGTPLACAVGLKVMEVIQRDQLASNARTVGGYLKSELERLGQKFPHVISIVRGLGLMLGVELAGGIPSFARSERAPSIQFVNRLHEAGLLAIPAGNQVLRLLPPLNLSRREAEEGIQILESVIVKLGT